MKQARAHIEASDTPFVRRMWRDGCLAVGLLLMGLLACFLVYVCSGAGTTVCVTVSGETVGEYPLALDATYILNGGTNTLIIEGGEAYIRHSVCPDHRCERGRISRVGESLTCLPNRVQVRVTGEHRNEADFVS